MNQYLPAIAAVIAGIFAIISACISWKLKDGTDKKINKENRIKEKYEEEKLLYSNTFQLFENTIGEVVERKGFTEAKAFSENNANIQLLAPRKVIDQYEEAASLLESWSILYEKANPKQMKVGEDTVTIIQSPDPTAQYKEPAKIEYEKLQKSLRQLVELMRSELKNNA